MAPRGRLIVGAFLLFVCAPLTARIDAELVQSQLPPAPPPPAPLPVLLSDVLDPVLTSRASASTGSSHVIVRAADAASVATVATLIETLGGAAGRRLALLDAVAAEVPNASLLALASNPAVRRIAVDRVTLGQMQRTAAITGAAAVREAFGYDGAGIGVAVIDSGITSWHDDLGTADLPGTQRVAAFADFVGSESAPYDDYGHGTHVAGIIAGNGYDSGGGRQGMAPSSRLVVLKVLDGSGRGRISQVIAALEYVVAHRHELNIRVVNLSIAAPVTESYTSDFLALATKRAVEEGIVVVASAGNSGRAPDGRTVYGSIGAPGNAPWVLTVGAASHMGTNDRGDDTIAPFSSRGPTAVDHLAKPDLAAPGVGIVSLSAPGSELFSSKSSYLLAGTLNSSDRPYLSLSGTSQASPVVAGTVALMLQANPALTPNAVKAILQFTAEDRPQYDRFTQGAGFLNAEGAVALARYFANPSVGVYSSGAPWSGAVHWGNQRLSGGWLQPQMNGWANNTTWGAALSGNTEPVSWGVTCVDATCSQPDSWIEWSASCSGPDCDTVLWDGGRATNLVWGNTCAGGDCENTAWQGPPGTSDDVVWAGSDGETIVWGTSDSGDTIVWGTTHEDPSCAPVIWEE